MARPKNDMLRDFVLRHAEAEGARLAPVAARALGMTRASVNLCLRQLVAEGLLEATGATRARRYRLKTLERVMAGIDLGQTPQEDRLWQDQFRAPFAGLPENVRRICQAGFIEILGNAIAHSGGRNALVLVKRNYANTVLRIDDDGVGLFDRLAQGCGLAGRHEAVLELAKGGLSTGGADRAGQGILVTARLFDVFTIVSGGLTLTVRRRPDGGHGFRAELGDSDRKGTSVQMEIGTAAAHTMAQTMAPAMAPAIGAADRAGRSAITVPLCLAQAGGEDLVSRAKARKALARCEGAAELVLDFDGVPEIGPQFADEIFRVWAGAHQQVRLRAIQACADVALMIRHAMAAHAGSAKAA